MDKLQQLKIELQTKSEFNYENYSSTFELWKNIMQRIEELEDE